MGEDAKSTIVDRPGSTPKSVDEKRERSPAGRYESGDEIGRGGMGRVVEARDTMLDRVVAVKEALTTDAELLRRFARETKITARLEHPSIVPVYDAGVADGAPFYVMRRVTGRPLSDLIRNAPALNERLALIPHLLAAAQAIAHAHQRGIIHRDIKPSNILVGELGETVVIDWGLAKVIGEPDEVAADEPSPSASISLRTRIGVVFGTPGFMAPDQLRGESVGPQGDVYALGACLYNLLAGEPPHYSDDSTQMMKLAAQGPPPPIATRVSGVPAELSTIVDTAIDYDPARRYRDAGAFVEDLERFLAGQLVASHDYTSWERLVRNVRKHRAAFAIGAAALVLVIAIGGFSISQVIEERDRADAQAHLATEKRHEAEAARATADDRAELLLMSRARSLVDSNPTAAVASLRQLPPKSQRAGEARAIIHAAQMRGVAWAMRGVDEAPTSTHLDPTATRLAAITVTGMLRMWDLDKRAQLFEMQVERGMQAHFILDGKLLLLSGRGPTRTIDAVTGAERPSRLPPLRDVTVDERGSLAVGVDDQQHAVVCDLETRSTTVIAEHADDIAVSPDGALRVVRVGTDVIVFDRRGQVIAKLDGKFPTGHFAVSNERVAVIDDLDVYMIDVANKGTWTRLDLRRSIGSRPLWIEFLNNRLFMSSIDGHIFSSHVGSELWEIGRIERVTVAMTPFSTDYLVVGSDGREIDYVDGAQSFKLVLPIALGAIRIVTRADRPRIVAIGDGAIVVVETGLFPRTLDLPLHTQTVFVGARTLLGSRSLHTDFAWYDIETRAHAPFEVGVVDLVIAIDTTQGTIALREVTPNGHRASIFTAGTSEPRLVVEPPYEELQLLGDGGVIFSAGNKVYDATRSELFTANGRVQILVRLGGRRFAAVAEHEIVRGELGKPGIERVPLDDGPPTKFATNHHGDTIIARGNAILRWSSTLEELASFHAPVDVIIGVERGVFAILSDGSSMFIAADGTHTRLASMRGLLLTSEQRLVVPGQTHFEVVELPGLERWPITIPTTRHILASQLDLSPDGMIVTESAGDGRVWLHRLPPANEDFGTLIEVTNIVEDKGGVLSFPWQSTTRDLRSPGAPPSGDRSHGAP